MAVLHQTVDDALNFFGGQVGLKLNSDIFSFIGPIDYQLLTQFRANMELLAEGPRSEDDPKPDSLAFFIQTPGGIAEVVEKMVQIIRHHYKDVSFVVPDMAMSAGTILCMSGDKIYMDYTSSLGPIDPQIANSEGQYVPALGYLDQVDRLIEKSNAGTLTDAEFALLQNQDLATLRRYEQARDLSITLLKDWLVKYKFKDWAEHSTNNPGTPVTEEEKATRAQEIATILSDHKHWHSHGRMIDMKTLQSHLRLQIEDYTHDIALKQAIRHYSDLLIDTAQTRGQNAIFHYSALKRTAI